MNNSQLKWAKRFKWISLAEGLSFLLLLGIAMPLKYGFDLPLAVK
jgi:integral membrane protein